MYTQSEIENALRWCHEMGYYACPPEIQAILDWFDR